MLFIKPTTPAQNMGLKYMRRMEGERTFSGKRTKMIPRMISQPMSKVERNAIHKAYNWSSKAGTKNMYAQDRRRKDIFR